MIERVQLWLHHHYDGVKLVAVFATLFLTAFFLMLYVRTEAANTRRVAATAAQESKAREENLKRALAVLNQQAEDIKRNTGRGVRITTCLLQVHGEFQLVTEKDEAACRRIVREEGRTREQVLEASGSSESQSSQSTPRTQQKPPAPPPKQPEDPEPPEEEPGLVENFVDGLFNLLP